MTRGSKESLPPEVLARISRLELETRQVVEGFLSGLHRSPYFGQSIEFVQHREYVAGDDFRRIDWKVWSKTDRYYIKQYEEETNVRATLVVDLSESMQFGSTHGTKFDYACRIAAALAYLLLKQNDAVGLVTFDEVIRKRVPLSSQMSHFYALLASLHAEKPAKKTGLQSILSQIADEKSRRGMVVLISDLFSERSSLFKGLSLLRLRGHDVLVFHVLDDQEVDFDYAGTTRFEGLEETGMLTCDPRALRDDYLAAMRSFLDETRRFCVGHQMDYQTVKTSEHLDAVLRHYLAHRVGTHAGKLHA